MRYLLILLLTISCSGKDREKAEPSPDPQLEALREKYAARLVEAENVRDPETGWLSRHDCDAMIWAGKYAASSGVTGVNITAAEYPEAPGKFGRRPKPYCWNEVEGDVGSKTEWSRDMFVAGLLPYAWLKAERGILERHAAYGKANTWFMGSPVDDGRVIYTPALIGLLYKAIFGLGGELDNNALWPDVYPSGLVDYQAHLQVMSIWAQGEIAAKLNDADAVPKDDPEPDHAKALRVSDSMYHRLEEHAGREPNCPLYTGVLGLYTGDMSKAIDSLLIRDNPDCTYLRCADGQCFLSEWIFSASLVLASFD